MLRERISDNFATGYQTMTAIIQGVALVVLVTASARAIFGTASGSQVATAASQAVAVFVIIIVTTDQFFQLAAATRWLPTTFDTAISNLIGAGEATAALSLGDNTRWWGGISWSLLAGAFAFGHSAARATPKGSRHRRLLPAVHPRRAALQKHLRRIECPGCRAGRDDGPGTPASMAVHNSALGSNCDRCRPPSANSGGAASRQQTPHSLARTRAEPTPAGKQPPGLLGPVEKITRISVGRRDGGPRLLSRFVFLAAVRVSVVRRRTCPARQVSRDQPASGNNDAVAFRPARMSPPHWPAAI